MMTHYLFPRSKGLILNKIGIKTRPRVPLGKYKYKMSSPSRDMIKIKNKQPYIAMHLGLRYSCYGNIMSVQVQPSTTSTKKTGLLSTFCYASVTLQRNKYHRK